MLVVGLTGSIAMGKSTTAAALRRSGIPVHDADAAVHRLMAVGGAAVPALAAAFPSAVRGGQVDRRALGKIVFSDPAALRRLEGLLHPLVQEDSRRFLQRAALRGCRLAVLDIPLLFETGADRRVDAVIVVSAGPVIQAQRVLARPGMDRATLRAILGRQMADWKKRARADHVVPTGLGRGPAVRALKIALSQASRRGRCRRPPGWPRYRKRP